MDAKLASMREVSDIWDALYCMSGPKNFDHTLERR